MLKTAISAAALCMILLASPASAGVGICMVSTKPSWADYCAKKAACLLPSGKLATMCVSWRKIR
jgi:hypothetical protein